MRKLIWTIFAATVVLGTSGCGGSNNGTSNNPNPYAGNWAGTFQASGNPTEQLNLSIGSDGSITGTETVGSSTTADSGVVHINGTFGIRSRLAGTPDANLSGTMFFTNQGVLHGEGVITQSGNSSNFIFDLNQQ